MIPILLAVLLQEPSPGAIDAAVKSCRGYDTKNQAPIAADDVFFRRLVLDLHGRSAEEPELAAFKADPAPDKRRRAVAALLDDPRFSKRWARRLAELLLGDLDRVAFDQIPGVLPEVAPAAVGHFVRWLENQVAKELPWTEMVSQMIDARGQLEGDPALAFLLSFHRGRGADVEFAEGLARRLLGIRLYCARCHDHPYDRWTTQDYWSLAAFRARQDVRAAAAGRTVVLKYLDAGEREEPSFVTAPGSKVKLADGGTARPQFLFGGTAEGTDDRMKRLAELLTAKANTQLPRALANRVWGWLMSDGVVSPADDFNLRNKALSPSLLDTLTRFGSIRALAKAICETEAYQRCTPEEAPGDFSSFRHLALARRSVPYPPPGGKRPALPFAFEPAEAWVRRQPHTGARIVWSLPDKEGKARDAELRLLKEVADPDAARSWSARFGGAKSTSAPLDGALAGTVFEIAGEYTCDRGADGAYAARVLRVSLAWAQEAWVAELSGPVDTVDDWRAEVLERLRKASAP